MATRLTTDKAVSFILQNRLAINAVRLEREGVLQEHHKVEDEDDDEDENDRKRCTGRTP